MLIPTDMIIWRFHLTIKNLYIQTDENYNHNSYTTKFYWV